MRSTQSQIQYKTTISKLTEQEEKKTQRSLGPVIASKDIFLFDAVVDKPVSPVTGLQQCFITEYLLIAITLFLQKY